LPRLPGPSMLKPSRSLQTSVAPLTSATKRVPLCTVKRIPVHDHAIGRQ
jgi:hypothetical protein